MPFHNLSLDTYTNPNVNNLRQSQLGFQLIESNNISLANNPAHKIVYTATDGWTRDKGSLYNKGR
ncbi:MAG: hypothetical protein WCF03_20420 [Nitrososphaeraceae archaeon]